MVDRKAYHTKLEFDWVPGEALYGLGSHEEGMFNLRGAAPVSLPTKHEGCYSGAGLHARLWDHFG